MIKFIDNLFGISAKAKQESIKTYNWILRNRCRNLILTIKRLKNIVQLYKDNPVPRYMLEEYNRISEALDQFNRMIEVQDISYTSTPTIPKPYGNPDVKNNTLVCPSYCKGCSYEYHKINTNPIGPKGCYALYRHMHNIRIINNINKLEALEKEVNILRNLPKEQGYEIQ